MSAADSGVPAGGAAGQPDLVRWLGQAWGEALAQVMESMAAGRPAVSWEAGGALAGPPPGEAALRWSQQFDLDAGACAWSSLSEQHWRLIGVQALGAAGLDDATDEDTRSTCQEVLAQSFALFAEKLAALAGRAVAATAGSEAGIAEDAAVGGSVQCRFAGGEAVTAHLAYSQALLKALAQPAGTAGPAPAHRPPPAQEPASATLDLLREVELPVSISFGRARMLLQDVLRLAAGSVIELDRAVSEPVSLVVNDTVVALGEVVVIEGNYGVRIQQIMGREKLLHSGGLG